MINVTIWNENVEEHWAEIAKNASDEDGAHRLEVGRQVNRIHPEGIHGTLAGIFDGVEDIAVQKVTMDMPENGLTDEVLNRTDVLIWWGHVAHEAVDDAVAEKVQDRVLRGMGFIGLHSAHMCKPLRRLLGTGMTLSWREGDFCRVWNTQPNHPIALGIGPYFELPEEEMYGEFFDIPKPDDVVFTGWFRGGEVFRSGCTWTRGNGRIFYFQPGHETYGSYYNEDVRRVIRNAVRWAAPKQIVPKRECPNVLVTPEMLSRPSTMREGT